MSDHILSRPWKALFGFFLPPNTDTFDIEAIRRAKFLIGASTILVVVFVLGNVLPPLLLEKLPWYFPIESAFRALTSVALLANLWWFRKRKDLYLCSFLFLLALAVLSAVVTFYGGGTRSSGIYNLLVLPILASFLLSIRWGWVSALGLLLFLGLLHYLTTKGYTPPPFVQQGLPLRLTIFINVLIILMGALWLFESNRAAAMDALRESHEENLELVMARDRAVFATQAKNEFLATMSHELRTPLNAIVGYAEILEEDAMDDGLESYIQDLARIKQSGHHLLSLINDLLDLSKIEAGHLSLSYETVELSSFLEELDAEIQPLVKKNANQFQLRQHAELSFQTDPKRLRQILLNLLGNAAKFTKQGQIALSVEVQPGEEGESELCFSVEDTGIGMSKEDQQRVFERFIQADNSTTRKYGGTGLGLTISKDLCELMGGRIEVSSEQGVGSTFTVRLPLVSGALAGSSTSWPAPVYLPTPGFPARPAQRGALALIVDDEYSVIDLLGRLLREEGYEVIASSSSQEALGLARQLKPSLITLDVKMDGIDGWTLLTQMKEDAELQAIPVWMVSVLDEKDKGFALGASEYITKPFSRETLRSILKKYEGRV